MKLNNTTKFILPLIVKNDYDSTIIDENDISNTYVADMSNPEYDNTIMVVAKDYVNNKYFTVKPVAKYKNIDMSETVQVFDVPKSKVEDYYSLVTSNFKVVSDEVKERILKFWEGNKDVYDEIKDIFDKAEDLSFDIKAEMYDSYSIKNPVEDVD